MKKTAAPSCCLFLAALVCFTWGSAGRHGTEKPAVIDTPVQADNLDPTAFAAWVDGQETPLAGPDKSQSPQWVIWTTKTNPGHSGCTFGDTRTPGPRHLRIGFQRPVAVGSVFVSGGGQLSVLKPGAAYPGNLSSDADWIAAQRFDKGELSRADVGKQECAVWTLPPGTETRALRFTHIASPSDPAYAAHLGGAYVTSARWNNVAPLALASASANPHHASRFNNGNDASQMWDNLDSREPAPDGAPVVSPQHPQWAMLTWPAPIKLGGLMALDAGFAAAEVQAYVGPADKHPRDADDAEWKSVGTFAGLKSGYPIALWPNPMLFGQAMTTRAIRLKMTAPTMENHPHLQGAAKGGKRVWLGELMALQPLDHSPLQAVALSAPEGDVTHAPIPVPFKLEQSGFVTLVIEDEAGKRVRNLISETPFPAGENVAWWDGTDDLGRDLDAARHGLYKIPAHFVAPGNYHVRGLVPASIEPHYEFPIYSGGNPAWETADKSGGWLTNHTPPQAALFVPAAQAPGGKDLIFLGSYVSEGGAGLAWVDLEGRKQGGRGWIGGNWTAAPYLARDAAAHNPLPDAYAYVGSVWATEKGSTKAELRITALTAAGGDKPILRHEFDPDDPKKMGSEIAGLAACNGVIVVSLPRQKQLIFVDAKAGKLSGVSAARRSARRGLRFQGHLLALAGKKALRFSIAPAGVSGAPQELIASGLDDPRGVTLDPKDQIYISDGGASHQVKVFDQGGHLLRTDRQARRAAAGPYDPLHMNNPQGMAIDPAGHLWVTENDFLPKRVSVWNADGTLWKAFYGPAKYGGGGTLDSQDKSRFYYADEGRGSMEFKLDWVKGESQLLRVLYRPQPGDLELATRAAAPELPLYRDGQRYFANCYNSSPTNGTGTAFLFMDRDGLARPVAAIGRASSWPVL